MDTCDPSGVGVKRLVNVPLLHPRVNRVMWRNALMSHAVGVTATAMVKSGVGVRRLNTYTTAPPKREERGKRGETGWRSGTRQ